MGYRGFNFRKNKQIKEKTMDAKQVKPTLDEIYKSAVLLFGNDDFMKKTNKREIVRQRQVVHYVAHRVFKYGQAKVGAKFGFKDHSTVAHSTKTIENEIEHYKCIENNVKALVGLCKGSMKKRTPESIIIDILSRDYILEEDKALLRDVLSLIFK